MLEAPYYLKMEYSSTLQEIWVVRLEIQTGKLAFESMSAKYR